MSAVSEIVYEKLEQQEIRAKAVVTCCVFLPAGSDYGSCQVVDLCPQIGMKLKPWMLMLPCTVVSGKGTHLHR